ncbi:MAG: toprim domain-containing protein [Acidimicrobiales bacterium]
MSFDDLRRRAAVVREIALEAVLLCRGAERDRRDRSKWHSEQGPLSVTGAKFTSWRRCEGGGGAIDLVMHLARVDYRTAVEWLEQHFAVGPLPGGQAAVQSLARPPSACTPPLPLAADRLLGRVRQYLRQRRRLSAVLLEPLIQTGRLYADHRSNAVFLLVAGKAQRPVGAELRGTGPHVWHGLAPGTHKDLGYFWIGAPGSGSIVLCESAIDAISCYQLHPEHICISTSGVRADPPWLAVLLAHGYQIHCGFDADEPGDAAAARMIGLNPTVTRLRPPDHDWNDVLRSRS